MKKLMALLFCCTLLFSCVSPAALAADVYLEDYGITVDVPDGWTLLYGDELDRRRSLIEHGGEASKGDPDEIDGVYTAFTAFSEDGSTELQFTAVKNSFSEDAFNLQRVPKEYKDDEIKGLQNGRGSNFMGMVYEKSKYYEQDEAQFIEYSITWSFGEREVPVLKYYTVVNGFNYSVNLYCWDEDMSEEDILLVRNMVDSIHFDEILEATEDFRGYDTVTFSGAFWTIFLVVLGVAVLFAIYTFSDWKPVVVRFVKGLFKRKN